MAYIKNSLGNITFNDAQNNIDIVKYISTVNALTVEDVVDQLNNISPFTINEIQSLWIIHYVCVQSEINFVFDIIQINKFKVINKGKGTYGLDGIPLTVDDMLLVSSTSVNLDDIENNPLTQIYTISDLNGVSISEYINELDPSFEFQDVSVAPRLIKITEIGLEASYLFLPVSGLYGLNDLQTTDADFQLLDNTSQIQNNIQIPIVYTLSEIGATSWDDDIPTLLAAYVASQNITIGETEIYSFEVNDELNKRQVYTLNSRGKGNINDLQSEDLYKLVNENNSSGSIGQILIQEASQIVNQELDSTKVYVLENQITLSSGESIIVPDTGLTLVGYGFNISSIFSSVAGIKIFTSPVGGSGDLILDKLSITNVGTGSKVFDIVDSTGQHAIEIEYVNFSDCKSLGKIDGYRQGTVTTSGLYGCADGLQLSGAWNGFKATNTNVFGFGNTGILIKKDSDTTFTNRLFLSLNLDFPTGAILTDMISDNFLSDELLQINSSIVKVNGTINSDFAVDLIPELSANDTKCLWIGNIGLPDTAIENFVEDDNISVFYNIDWLKDTYLLTMTDDTTFTESNLPASGKNTQEIKIYLQGNFIPTFPSDWLTNAVGTYKGSDLNEITLKFIKTGVYFMKIDNTLSVYPKPSLQNLVPTSLLPSTTSSLTINGSFFTPETIVSIENQTVNSVEFINQGQLVLSVTTSNIEEEVDITISNGTTVVFSGILPINLGVVFIPSETDWINVVNVPDLSTNGQFKILASDVPYQATLPYIIGTSQNFSFRAKYKVNPVKITGDADFLGNNGCAVLFQNTVDSSTIFRIMPRIYDIPTNIGNATVANLVTSAELQTNVGVLDKVVELRRVGGVVTFLIDNILIYTFAINNTNSLKIKMINENLDAIDIKYIELP